MSGPARPAERSRGPHCAEPHGTRRSAHGLEVADVLRAHAGSLRLSPERARVARAIVRCRTAALGGHVRECDHCGRREVSYNSCRNRHCPKCLGARAKQWLADRERDLLPVPYFHVVFTIPRALHPFFRADPRAAYGMLMRAAAATLKEVAANPDNLGARVGFTTVLHTWTQLLGFHPHVHCVVTGGGLDPIGTHWISTERSRAGNDFFVAVEKLAAVFRGKLLSSLEAATLEGRLTAPPRPKRTLVRAARRGWNVYAKRPFAGPGQVLRYLSRYTHRVAISNARLVSMDERGNVTFRWRDRSDGNAQKLDTISGKEFTRRFLQHVLPRGFHRIRHYGILASAAKGTAIPLVRGLLGTEAPTPPPDPGDDEPQDPICPRCKRGRLVVVDAIPRCPSTSPWHQRGPP